MPCTGTRGQNYTGKGTVPRTGAGHENVTGSVVAPLQNGTFRWTGPTLQSPAVYSTASTVTRTRIIWGIVGWIGLAIS